MKKISDFNSATEKYPVVYAGSATRPEFVDMPTTLQQQEGVAPMETLPAQWWNAMWKLATKDINAFRDYVGDAFTEINNLLVKFNITLDDADSEQLYDFFHDDYVQNYLSTIFLSQNGGTIDGDLHIKGDLSVDGIGEEVISTELKVGANTITLRNDNPTGLGNTELAGVVTENYDGNNNNNIIAIDKNGVARVGDIDIATRILYSNDGTNFYLDEDLTNAATIGANEEVRDTGNQTAGGVEIYEGVTYSNDNTQALATRENTPLNGGYAVWNSTLKRFDTVPQGQNKSSFTIFVPGGDEVALSGPLTKNVTVAGITALSDGMSVQVMFTSAIQSTNSITQLKLNINSLGDVPIKAPGNNTLKYLTSHLLSSGGGFDPTYPNRLCDAWISLDLVYSASETAWIVVGNPIVMSCPDYEIYANGQVGGGNVGDVKAISLVNIPYGWAECNGQSVSRTQYADLFNRFNTQTQEVGGVTKTLLEIYGYVDSDHFNLPDYREVALVGAGQNDSDAIETHDVYTIGQFKDDSLQAHTHRILINNIFSNLVDNSTIQSAGGSANVDSTLVGNPIAGNSSNLGGIVPFGVGNVRTGAVTHGKRKGVKYIIKIL